MSMKALYSTFSETIRQFSARYRHKFSIQKFTDKSKYGNFDMNEICP